MAAETVPLFGILRKKPRSETSAASSLGTVKSNLHFDSDYVNLLAKATWLLDSP